MPIFDPTTLRTAVAEALATADVGDARNAFVAVVTRDRTGAVVVRGAITTKLDDHWTVSALVTIDHEARIEGGLEVKAVW